MENSENRSDFEKAWEEAFRNAEKSPPEAVWDRIENVLVNEKANHYKKRLFLFKLLAAASLVFAMGIGIYSFYTQDTERPRTVSESKGNHLPSSNDAGTERQNQTIYDQKTENNAEKPADQLAQNNLSVQGISNETNPIKTRARDNAIAGKSALNVNTVTSSGRDDNQIINTQNMGTAALLSSNNELMDKSRVAHGSLNLENMEMAALTPIFDARGKVTSNIPLDHIYLMPFIPAKTDKTEENRTPEFFAGVDFSTGVYDPNFSSARMEALPTSNYVALASADFAKYSTATTQQNNSLSREQYKPDLVYSYGANVGTKLGKRWWVATGVNYIKANSIANTTAYYQNQNDNSRVALLNTYNYQNQGITEIKQSSQMDLINYYEFASVPVKAGYIILNRALNIAVLAGVSSDFYLGGKILDKNNFVEDVSITPGEQSPYKSVYFNGIIGTSFGYAFAEHYQLSLEPNYRMAINSLTKDSFVMSSNPATWQISFGLRYQFK